MKLSEAVRQNIYTQPNDGTGHTTDTNAIADKISLLEHERFALQIKVDQLEKIIEEAWDAGRRGADTKRFNLSSTITLRVDMNDEGKQSD